jgi:hypothetical protein
MDLRTLMIVDRHTSPATTAAKLDCQRLLRSLRRSNPSLGAQLYIYSLTLQSQQSTSAEWYQGGLLSPSFRQALFESKAYVIGGNRRFVVFGHMDALGLEEGITPQPVLFSQDQPF